MMKVKVQLPAEWLRYCIIGKSTLRLLQYHSLIGNFEKAPSGILLQGVKATL